MAVAGKSRTLAERRAKQREQLLRTSERATFKRCRWLWRQEFIEGLKPKEHLSPRALRFGSLIHRSLADYYLKGKRRGPHPAESFIKYYDEQAARVQDELQIYVEEDEAWVEARELGEGMLTNYIDTYGKDERYKVLMTEQPFQMPVTFNGKHLFTYVGIIDGVWLDTETDKIFIVDHKTAAAINTKYLALDDQAAAYWTFGQDWIRQQGVLKRGEKLQGMMFNYLRKQMPDERAFRWNNGVKVYLNNDGSDSKKQPAPYFKRQPTYRGEFERAELRRRVLAEHWDMQQVRREPEAGAYKNPGQFTCVGCWAFDFCELHEAGHDWEELRAQMTRPWDAYAEHETYLAETRS